MGQKLSQQKISTDAKAFMRKYYPEYPYVELLNDGIMYKTVIITNDKDQSPLLLKIFYKDDYTEKDKKQFEMELEKVKNLQKKILSDTYKLNIVPIINIKNTERSGILYRQYIGISLKERMYLMPYLTYIDKIWITFQLLYLFNNLEKNQIFHGDVKPENILLTSNLSVYLADFATYKPAYIYVDDLASYTYYFGSYNSDNLKGCYLAPERLCDKNDSTENEEKNSAMDVFSLGLVIAELFLEKNIFDFASLLNYKKGNISKQKIEELLKGITNEKIKNIILEMIKIDPKERITINNALNKFTNEVCPLAMTGFLFHLNILVNKTEYWRPDLLIGFLYRYWDTIWKLIYGLNSIPPQLFQRMNFPIINKLIADNPVTLNLRYTIFKRDNKGIYYIDDYKFLFDPIDGKINYKCENENIFKMNNNEECIFIIINLILQNMQNTKYETSNYVAMEMLKNFCIKLPDITKLQVIIPYFINNIKRSSYTTKLTSLKYIFDILYSFNYRDLILPVTEYNYFDSYIFPKILKFYKPQKPYLVLEFLNNIDKIIDLELKFLNITLRSRIKRLTEMVNEERNFLLKNSNNYTIVKREEKYNEINRKKKRRIEEIYNDYDTYLESFKDNLFNVISDIIGNINEIDLIIITIRKLPCLLDFYGRKKSNDFSKFIINNFNKNEWIIQKEILTQIPKMMNTLGQNILDTFILPCMEMLIGNNSNDFKTYKLIESINLLLKMEILSPKNGINFLINLLPYSLHPNTLIHNEIFDLIKNLLNFLNPEEKFLYLRNAFIPYLKIPFLSLDFNTINNNYLRKVNRCYYMLKLNQINFNFDEYNSKNKIELEKIPQFSLIEDTIEKEKNGNLTTNNTEDIIFIFNDENDDLINTIKKYSLVEPLNKYIKKESEKNKLYGEELDKKVFGKIFWLSSEKERYKIPYIKDENFFSLEKSEERIPTELFQINYVLKTLSISIKLVKLNFLLGFNKNIQTSINPINPKDSNILLGNFYYNKNFSNWRPQGRLMTTAYDHQRPIEKLIPMKNKKFCSFDSECNPIIWKIKGTNDEFILKKKWNMNLKEEYSLSYKKTINYLDNLFFIFGSEKTLYSINFISVPPNVDKLCESPDESNITCTYLIGDNILDSQKILFTTENGSINLFDQRINGISLSNNLNKSIGIPYCISEFYENFFLIGTLSGKLLKYDLRINKIISEHNYNDNTPILGMILCKQNKDKNKSLLIWSGNEDYEIGMWNIDDKYNISNICNLLLKVNSIDQDDEKTYEPLLLEIPLIDSQNLNNKNDEILINNRTNIEKDFTNLNKYTYIYNTSSNRHLIYSKIKKELYFSCKKNLNNLCNIYENPTTVQCVLSPLCGENSYDNASYIITGGNDRTIRYWDLARDLAGKYVSRNSYIVNTPTNMTNCVYKKFKINGTLVLESNEVFNQPETKNKIPGFSDYQNYNGINYYSSEKNIQSGYSTRNLDVSHKSVVTDLLAFNLDDDYTENPHNFLVSSSWDGTIKVWK
jgi:phosphoinositide-3-kinase regulatory subunit 4